MEYRAGADVGCRFEQTPEGLAVSVVKAQRIYDDHRWPNPVVVKLENILPAISEAVIVETGASKRAEDGGLTLSGSVYKFKEKGVSRARFACRPYAGQVETLYAGKWKFTDWINLDGDGHFSIIIKGIDGALEYKAVAQQNNIDIDGESKVAGPSATSPVK
jgi:alpha-L-fucosidase